MGIYVVVFSPAGNVPAKDDYFTVMEQNLLKLKNFTQQASE